LLLPAEGKFENNGDCLFGPMIGQRHKSPSNGPSASYPVAFRAALGGFLVGCVELGMKRSGNVRFFKMAGGKSKHIELNRRIREKQGYLQKIKQKSKTRDSRIDGKVIVLLNHRNISLPFA